MTAGNIHRQHRGKSAYEIAVDEGFVGNEAAWLASLVGDDGDPGADGEPSGGQWPVPIGWYVGPTGLTGYVAGTVSSSWNNTTELMRFVPLELSAEMTFDEIACSVIVATNSTAASVRMGIYESDPDTGVPTDLIAEGTTQPSILVNGVKSAALDPPVVLPPGRYYLALVCQGDDGAFTNPTFHSGTAHEAVAGWGTALPTGNSAFVIYQQASVAGALPATATDPPQVLVQNAGAAARVWLKRSA
jgi:hypothetical protein